MELSKIINRKNSQITLLLVLMVSLYSCGTYQSAYNNDDDGIYSSSNNQHQQEVVIVENNSNFDKDYFSRQLEDLQNLNEDDTFTNIDEYYYEDAEVENDTVYNDYDAPWEYTNTVVINMNSGYASSDYYWHSPFYYPYHNYNPYYSNYYSPWRYYNPYNYSYNYYGYSYPYYEYGYYGSYYPYYSYPRYNNYYSPYYSYNNYNRYDSYGK